MPSPSHGGVGVRARTRRPELDDTPARQTLAEWAQITAQVAPFFFAVVVL